MKRVFGLILILSLGLIAYGCYEDKNAVTIGDGEKYVEKRINSKTDIKETINNKIQIEFEEMSSDMLAKDLMDRINKSKNSEGYELIKDGNKNFFVVYMGEKPDGGYSVVVDDIVFENDLIIVNITERSLGKHLISTLAITYPYEIVEVKFEDDMLGKEIIVNKSYVEVQ